MTNVLLVSPYFWEPPKIYYGVYWTAVNLRRRGHKVVAVSSRIHDSRESEVIEGVHVYRIPAFYLSRIPWAIAFPAILWKYLGNLIELYKIELVHLQELAFPCDLFAALYCRRKHMPYVVTSHGAYFSLGWGFVPDVILDIYALVFGRLTLRFAEKVAAISKGQIPILNKLGVPSEKIVFTPLGINTDASIFERATERDRREARKNLNLAEEDFVVGFVGRLAPDKNVGLLLDSASLLTGKIKNLKLVIVGAGVEEQMLRKKALQLGLEPSVSFFGWREDIDKILPALDVFAFPSLSDGLGRAFVEAMTVGVPVVSTDVPGPASIISDGKNGLLVPRNNVSAMTDAILRLYNDEKLRSKLSENGSSVNQVFSWESCMLKLEAMYREVLKYRNPILHKVGV
jgi:glycosyltransferase involved in cell wall biosynthesis